jgi:type I restriction enzyme R subunit
MWLSSNGCWPAPISRMLQISTARCESHGLGLFVRSLVGLERDAAEQAFAGFIDGRALSSNQLDFIRLVVDHLTENGAMEADRLYESPFTDFAPQGPEEIFPTEYADELFAAIEAVRARAEPRDEAA